MTHSHEADHIDSETTTQPVGYEDIAAIGQQRANEIAASFAPATGATPDSVTETSAARAAVSAAYEDTLSRHEPRSIGTAEGDWDFVRAQRSGGNTVDQNLKDGSVVVTNADGNARMFSTLDDAREVLESLQQPESTPTLTDTNTPLKGIDLSFAARQQTRDTTPYEANDPTPSTPEVVVSKEQLVEEILDISKGTVAIYTILDPGKTSNEQIDKNHQERGGNNDKRNGLGGWGDYGDRIISHNREMTDMYANPPELLKFVMTEEGTVEVQYHFQGNARGMVDSTGRPGNSLNMHFIVPAQMAEKLQAQVINDPSLMDEVVRQQAEAVGIDAKDWSMVQPSSNKYKQLDKQGRPIPYSVGKPEDRKLIVQAIDTEPIEVPFLIS